MFPRAARSLRFGCRNERGLEYRLQSGSIRSPRVSKGSDDDRALPDGRASDTLQSGFLQRNNSRAPTNARVNFDLGIAAQTVAPGSQLASLENDFNQINNILGSMIIKVRSDIEEVSPWIKLLDRYASQTEDQMINFSLGKARASAWLVAQMVNSTPANQLARELSILDDGVAMLGALIGSPKEWLISLGLHVIRFRERNDVPQVIDVLNQM